MIKLYATKGLEEIEFKAVIGLIRKNCPSALNLFDHLEKVGCSKNCPPELKDLLLMISSNSPVCAFLPPTEEVFQLIAELSEASEQNNYDTYSPEFLRMLQNKIPMIYQIVNKIRDVSLYLKTLFKQMMVISERTFNEKDSKKEEEFIEQERNDPSSFFPSLPQVRHRGVYKADRLTNKDGKVCNKQSTRHPTLLPGIFTAFCEHGEKDVIIC